MGGGLGALFGRTRAILRCLLMIAGCTGAIICCLLAIARCFGVIIRRLLMIACGPERLLLSSHRLSRLDGIVFPVGVGVTRVRHLVTLVRGGVSRRCGSQASARLLLSEMRRMLTMRAARVPRVLISPLGFLVAGGLILV
jgi:hypothetical protein